MSLKSVNNQLDIYNPRRKLTLEKKQTIPAVAILILLVGTIIRILYLSQDD